MNHLILTLALLCTTSHAALRGGGGPTMPTNPAPTPDQPVTSWQPPFPIIR